MYTFCAAACPRPYKCLQVESVHIFGSSKTNFITDTLLMCIKYLLNNILVENINF